MDKQLYASLANRASDLVVAGERLKAIGVLEELVRSDLPAFDRAMMCMNIAIIYNQMGDSDKALETYSRAIDLEQAAESYFVAQSRAAYYSGSSTKVSGLTTICSGMTTLSQEIARCF